MRPTGTKVGVRDPARGIPPDQVYVLPLAREVAWRIEEGARTAQAILQAMAALDGDRRRLAVALGLPDPELLEEVQVRRALHGIYEIEAALGAAYGRAHARRDGAMSRVALTTVAKDAVRHRGTDAEEGHER
jgi:hypothetical protein